MKLDPIPKESPPAAKPPARFLKNAEAVILRDVCITLCDAIIAVTEEPMPKARLLAARAALVGAQPAREPEFEDSDGQPF